MQLLSVCNSFLFRFSVLIVNNIFAKMYFRCLVPYIAIKCFHVLKTLRIGHSNSMFLSNSANNKWKCTITTINFYTPFSTKL